MCEAHKGAVALWCFMTDVSVSSDVDEIVSSGAYMYTGHVCACAGTVVDW